MLNYLGGVLRNAISSQSQAREDLTCPNTLSLHLAYTDLLRSLHLFLIGNPKDKLNVGTSRAMGAV